MGSFGAVHWAIVAIILIPVFLLFKSLLGSIATGFRQGLSGNDGTMICPACGTRGEPHTVTRGSIGIEIVLWLCFLIPGLIYSLWRLTTRSGVCPACGQKGMIPVNSPNGQRLARQFETP